MTSQVNPDKLDVGKTRRRVEDALRKTVTPEQLIKVAQSLGVEPELLPESVVSCHHHHRCEGVYGLRRPNYGLNQVRCRQDLIPGHEYEYIYASSGSRFNFTVTREPYQKRDSWWIDFITATGSRQTLSLRDSNIEPNSDGSWYATSWIAFTNESRPINCCCHSHCHHGNHI